ncbi:MAG: hypothetical protein ACLSHG_12375 [Oscillospiraceae bacterium]
MALHLVQNGHTVTLLARRKLLRSAKLPAMNEPHAARPAHVPRRAHRRGRGAGIRRCQGRLLRGRGRARAGGG